MILLHNQGKNKITQRNYVFVVLLRVGKKLVICYILVQ